MDLWPLVSCVPKSPSFLIFSNLTLNNTLGQVRMTLYLDLGLVEVEDSVDGDL